LVPGKLYVICVTLSIRAAGPPLVRGSPLGVLACLAALLTLSCSGSELPQVEQLAQASSQPNIVFILTDDLDYNSALLMPEVNSRLIAEGTTFNNAFINYPLCCPSRATILTGLYAHNHGVKGNNSPEGGFEKFLSKGLEKDTIAVRLKESDYQTAFFGKYLKEYPADDPTHVPPGWDEWYGKQRGQRLYSYTINENGQVVSYGRETEDFYTDILSSQVTGFVRRIAPNPKPFFMYVAPTAPHSPATPAERHKDAFAGEEAPRPPSFDEEDVLDKPSFIRDKERFYEEDVSNVDDYYRERLRSLLAVDEMVAALIQELEAAGVLDNTYIIFTSDNGYHQGEHRIKNGKQTSYEESARVPFFVRGPGVPARSKIEKLIVNTDFAPTFADIAGVDFAADGRSLKLLFEGEESVWRHALLLENLSDNEGEEGEAGGQDENNSPTYKAIRTESHKYVEYDNGERELYDVHADPSELDNLYESAGSSLVDDLHTKLKALESCVGEECQKAENTP
jgi:N-acetylglucosamine-6-sulfatase